MGALSRFGEDSASGRETNVLIRPMTISGETIKVIWKGGNKDVNMRSMPLSPDEMAEMIARLERVCREAQELQERLRRAMVGRAREQQQLVSKGGAERRQAPRNRRSAERRKSKRP
jgi:hypothetical protein